VTHLHALAPRPPRPPIGGMAERSEQEHEGEAEAADEAEAEGQAADEDEGGHAHAAAEVRTDDSAIHELDALIEGNERDVDRQRSLLRSFEEEWESSYAGLQGAFAKQERALQAGAYTRSL